MDANVNLFVEFVKVAPGIAGMIVLTLAFLRSQAKRDEVITTLHREHIEERKECRTVTMECTKTLGAVNETNCRVSDALDRVAGKL